MTEQEAHLPADVYRRLLAIDATRRVRQTARRITRRVQHTLKRNHDTHLRVSVPEQHQRPEQQ